MKKNLTIFVVEDDKWFADLLAYQIKLNPDYLVEVFNSGKTLLQNMYKNPDIITLDYSLPDFKGETLLKEIKKIRPDIPVVVVSGQEDITTAINLLKEGAFDYIVKNEETKERVWNVLKNIRNNLSLRAENELLRSDISKKYSFTNIIKGESRPIKEVFKLMEKAANSDITVSISGDTGTGKELVAKAIHFNSTRKSKPFVAVNVGAIPSELIESELFGHEKGSFTGANVRRIGKFEEAHKGTLFLDEIGEMDTNTQTKILRALQEKEIVRVGSNKPIKVDVRIITATNRNLAEEVKKNRFRKDLYYRLIGLPIHLPPLKERNNDILILANHFAKEAAKENKKKKIKFAPEASKKLLRYPFPGNVRELKAIVDLAVVMASSDVITADDIIFNEIDSMSDLLLEETSLENYMVKIIKHYLDKYKSPTLVARKLKISKAKIYRVKNKFQF